MSGWCRRRRKDTLTLRRNLGSGTRPGAPGLILCLERRYHLHLLLIGHSVLEYSVSEDLPNSLQTSFSPDMGRHSGQPTQTQPDTVRKCRI